MKNNLTKVSSDIPVYTPPVCEVIPMEAQGVICTSETEIVGEIEGVW